MSVVIRKDGVYEVDWVYDDEKEEGHDEYKKIEGFELFRVWDAHFDDFEGEVTFRDFIQPWIHDEGILSMMNILTGTNVTEDWIRSINTTSDDSERPFVKLHVRPVLEANSHEEDFHDVTHYVGMHASCENSDSTWSCSWCPWGDFADKLMDWSERVQMPWITMTKHKRWPWERHKSKSPFKRKMKIDLKEVSYRPSFGEVVKGVFMEVTWGGTPDGAKEEQEEVTRRKKEVDDGEATLYELDLDAWMDGYDQPWTEVDAKTLKKKK